MHTHIQAYAQVLECTRTYKHTRRCSNAHAHTRIRTGAQSRRHDRGDSKLLFLVQLSRGVYSQKSAPWVDLPHKVTGVGTVPRQGLDPEQAPDLGRLFIQAPDPQVLDQTLSRGSSPSLDKGQTLGSLSEQAPDPRVLVQTFERALLASRRCRHGLTFENSQRCGWTRECRVPSSAESGCESLRTGTSSQKMALQSIVLVNALRHHAHRHRLFGTQTRRDSPRTVKTECRS